MDDTTLTALLLTAASVGVIHTLAGPDHYLPFVAMSRIGRWSLTKTVFITLACGVGHVLGSIILGVLGIALGAALSRLEWFESVRGGLAGWLLLGFGLAYAAWGVRQVLRKRPHSHVHVHEDGVVHTHEHRHLDEHSHVHAGDRRVDSMTPWILFTIFVFGPCEPLIPMLMLPAAALSGWGVGVVALVFAVATLGTMTAVVVIAHLGLRRVSTLPFARYGHVAAGLVVASCGAAMTLGL